MKTLLISFQPYWYEQIKIGEKLYEYRSAFPKETVAAYMYVSKPVQAIAGYAVFGGRIPLTEWAEKYKNNPVIFTRVQEYMERRKYVSEIHSFTEIKPIMLKDIKNTIPNFVIPQSYYFLDNYPILFEYVLNNTKRIESSTINNNFEFIDESKICSLRRD